MLRCLGFAAGWLALCLFAHAAAALDLTRLQMPPVNESVVRHRDRIVADLVRLVPDARIIADEMGRRAFETAEGENFRARLLIAADGARSLLRDEAGIAFFSGAYGQAALSGTIRHERPHGETAEEHFLPDGPFALLPLTDRDGAHRSSFVWTVSEKAAKRLVARGPEATARAVIETAGGQLGDLEIEGGIAQFPLRFGTAKTLTAERLALLGDAAQVIHPLAGQGLNLALGQTEALADCIVEALRLGLDLGAPQALNAYENSARFSGAAMLAATDALNRLFSNDSRALRTIRDFGLSLVNRSPAARAFFERRAAGG